MDDRKLQGIDLEFSGLTLGTWVFGGQMWGGSKGKDCIDAVRCAIDRGITSIDTAPIYGNGQSERIVGKGIKGRREKVLIATKCGIKFKNNRIVHDLSRDSIFEEADESLKRLGIDAIDLYQCHWPDPDTPIEETFSALETLREQGKIRQIGVSNFGPQLLKKAENFAEIATSQDQYSMISRDVEKGLLPYLKSKGIGLLAYGPLAGGILTGKYQDKPRFSKADARKFFYKFYEGDVFQNVKKLLNEMKSFDRPLNQIAINWVRQQPGVLSVLVGCRNPKQVEDNVAALEWKLTEEQLTRIEKMLGAFEHG